MNHTLPFSDLEKVYDLLGQAIDDVGEQEEALFLSKLCITLAHHIADVNIVKDAIRISKG